MDQSSTHTLMLTSEVRAHVCLVTQDLHG